MITDIEERLKRDEWFYLIDKYPIVAFNYRSFNGRLNSRENGYRIIYTAENYITMPEQWCEQTLKQYDYVITHNSKFAKDHSSCLDMRFLRGVLACNSYYYTLEKHTSYDNRIPAICVLSKLYHTGREGDILWLRQEAVDNIDAIPVHVWCNYGEWGGKKYKGRVESNILHSHINHLKKMDEYLFCLCFEPTYHPYWSWDFITERIFNCFRTKTVPIYIGCYNIDEYIPKDLYIDFREYYSSSHRDYQKLNKVLREFPKSRWVEMTEKAYEWSKKNVIGTAEELENTIYQISSDL